MKQLSLLFLIIICCISFGSACEMIAIKGLNGFNMNKNSMSNNIGSPLFNYFKDLGYDPNPVLTQERQGFGMVLYLNSSANTELGVVITENRLFQSDRRFAHYQLNATQDQNNYYPQANSLFLLGKEVEYSEINTVLAHKRLATTGTLTIPNPHPFVYRDLERSYSFTHNGTIQPYHLIQMNQYIQENIHIVQSDHELMSIYDTGSKTNRIDSAVYYTYLLLHIKANDMDILRGLQAALSSLDYYLSERENQHNFIFTDGYDLYAYRNGHHPLLYFYNSLKNIALITSSNRNFIEAFQNNDLQRIFPESSTTSNPIANITGSLALRSLIYIPGHGVPTIFSNFTSPDHIITLTRYYQKGWNWQGIPLIPEPPLTVKDYLMEEFLVNYPTMGNLLYFDRIESQKGFALYEDSPFYCWAWSDIFSSTMDGNFAMKMKMRDDTIKYDLPMRGKLAPLQPYSDIFLPNTGLQPNNNQYWVTYNLVSGQSVMDALGPYFAQIDRVYAENWVYYSLYPPVYQKNPENIALLPSLNCHRPMEFGKTYILELKSGVAPITNFQWTDSRQPALGRLNLQADFFTFEKNMEYEAVDIVNLSFNESSCIEIGAFANETCVGATKVEEFPIQILLYTKNYQGVPITFKALYSNGVVSVINPIVNRINTQTGDSSQGILIGGQIDCTITLLDNHFDYSKVSIPALITKHSVSPNPFNPSITIYFTTTHHSQITIDIFNLKGQKIQTILDKKLSSGSHYIQWDGVDHNNHSLASGVYLYRIKSDYHQVSGKMVLLK